MAGRTTERDGDAGARATDAPAPAGDRAVEAGAEGPTARDRLRAYATLVRVPNLFTAPPDVLLGAALATLVGLGGVDPLALAGGWLASVLLYAGGTTLNDVADAAVDARERPERPIPSGRVDRRRAGSLAAACLVGGVAVAVVAAGALAGGVAGLLAATVVAYDVRLKGRPAGNVAMGAARALNVGLGVAVVATPATLAAATDGPAAVLVAVPAVTLAYVAAVTRMADGEATAGDRHRPRVALAGLAAAGAALVAPLTAWTLAGPAATALAAALAGGFALLVGRPLRRAYRRPAPDVVGPAVGACVLGLIAFDAAVAAAAGPRWALAALAHYVPARLLARVVEVS